MSELKAFNCVDSDLQEFCEPRFVYLKSEADKVIADLEESHKKEVGQLLIEIVGLKKQVHDYAQGLYVIQARADKEICHHKYKRCLNMAERCRLEQERIELIENQDITDDDFEKLIKGFYIKWRNNWLELAEKFKD